MSRHGIGGNNPPEDQTLSLKVGARLPKTLGRCADAYHEVRELRLAMDKDVKRVKERENEIHDHILEHLSKSDDTGASGLKYKALVTSKEKASADDWEDIYDYIMENDRFDLLGKSLNQKTVAELWDNDEKVPGVKKVHVKSLSITKI